MSSGIYRMDSTFALKITPAMKSALQEIANRYSISISDVIRQSMLYGLPNLYPEWPVIYEENMSKGGLKK